MLNKINSEAGAKETRSTGQWPQQNLHAATTVNRTTAAAESGRRSVFFFIRTGIAVDLIQVQDNGRNTNCTLQLMSTGQRPQ